MITGMKAKERPENPLALGMLAMLAGLAAQEAERGSAARVWENGAIRALLAKAGAALETPGENLAWSALDAANAELRRALIRLHEAAEDRGDRALQIEILDLYSQMAKVRRLELSGG